MSALGKVVKEVAKNLPKEVLEEAPKIAKEVLPEVAGTAIKAEKQKAIKSAIKSGEILVTKSEAKKAAEKGYAYTAQKVKEQALTVDNIKNWANDAVIKYNSGEVTEQQLLKSVNENWQKIKTSMAERKFASSGPSQIMEQVSEDPLSVHLNEIVDGADKYMSENNVLNNLNVLRNIDSKEQLEALSIIKKAKVKNGDTKSFFDNIQTFGKNAMLIMHPFNRLLDAGANFTQRGVSLFNLRLAESLQGLGNKYANLLPDGTLKEVLSNPGIAQGSAARNLNASLVAIKDSAKVEARNVFNWIASTGKKQEETIIGKHARKIEAGYNWERNKEFQNVVLPQDLKSMIGLIKEQPIRKTLYASSYPLRQGGFAISKGLDDVSVGAFRAGDLASDAYNTAMIKAADLGKEGDIDFIEKLTKDIITADKGDPLPLSTTSKYTEMFGVGGFDDMVNQVSKSASKKAEMDVYRSGNLTKVGGWLENIDKSIIDSKIPLVGKIYDFFAPLARTMFRVTDRALYESPFASANRIGKAFRKAKYELEETGKTNSGEFMKAVADFTTASTAYTTAAILAANNIITGEAPKDKNQRKIWEARRINPYSINIGGYSLKYERFGAQGVALGMIVNVINDIKNTMEEYEDPGNIYGPQDAAADLISTFTTSPLWNTVFGSLIEDAELGKMTKQKVKQWSMIVPKLFSSMIEQFGSDDTEYLKKFYINTGKKLSDFRIRSKKKTDLFGNYIKDESTISQRKTLKEMFTQSAGVNPPSSTFSAEIDGVTIQLEYDEREAWNRMMHNYEIFDGDEGTGEYTSADAEMFSLISGATDATEAGELYNEISNAQFSSDGEKQEIKKELISKIYSDSKKNALKTLLSYKDKYAETEEEKEYARLAKKMWRRAQEAKKYYSKPIKPTMEIGL